MSGSAIDIVMGDRIGDDRRREAREAESSLLSSEVNLADTAVEGARWDIQLSKEQWDWQKKQAAGASSFATKFMGEWSSAMKGLKDVYGKTFDAIFGGGGDGGAIGGQVGKLNELGDLMTQEYKDYRERWGDTEQTFMEQAEFEGKARGEAIGTMQDLARPDYEGATGRAAADVKGQSEVARQNAAREMMGYGVDPSAGKFGALTRKSYLDEARNTAIAMNVARRGEKERTSKAQLDIANVADPRVSGSLALGISEGGRGMARTAADVYGAGAQALTAQTQALSNLTSSYGQNVVSPMGEMAGYAMGMGGIPGGGGGSSPHSVTLSRSRTAAIEPSAGTPTARL